MPSSEFWRDRQAGFERYAIEYSDLIANWDALGSQWWLQYGHRVEGILDVPQQCKDVFKAVARIVIAGFPDSRSLINERPGPHVGREAEPWEVWLDFLRVRNWGFRITAHTPCTEREWDAGVRDGKPLLAVRRQHKYSTGDEWTKVYRRIANGKLQRLSVKDLNGKSSEDLKKYYHWLENGAIEHVFRSSARFCETLASEAFELEMATNVTAAAPQSMKDLEELPPQLQNVFEAVKAKAELGYATRIERFPNHPRLAEFAIHQLKRIQDVFFGYCEQARNACRAGKWTAAQTRQHTDAAWPIICDFYFGREQGASSQGARLAFKDAIWRTVQDDPQWKYHLSELATLADRPRVPTVEPQNDATTSVTVPTVDEAPPLRKGRLSSTISSPLAARRMEAYIQSKQISQTEFANLAETTDRTIRQFRHTGKVRRNIFDLIAKAMGISRETLLEPE